MHKPVVIIEYVSVWEAVKEPIASENSSAWTQ